MAGEKPPDVVTPASPLPWTFGALTLANPGRERMIRSAEDVLVARMYCGWGGHPSIPEMDANARYIVTACNAFPELLELLRSIRRDASAYQWHATIDKVLTHGG
jgi:hypothetical protein